jgi:hypothetical protein
MWPLWVRVSIAFILIIGAWLLIICKAWHKPPMMALQIIALTFGIHLLVVALIVEIRKLRARFGLWQETRRLRREGTAVQPDDRRNGALLRN